MSNTIRAELAVIGGGASGILAAIFARKYGLSDVVLIEQKDKLGQPILRSGNGRCNITNTTITPCDYNNPEFVEHVFSHFEQSPYKSVERIFNDLGIIFTLEHNTRAYPNSKHASSVVNVLMSHLQRLNITPITNTKVLSLQYTNETYELTCRSKDTFVIEAQSVIIASGGASAQNLSLNSPITSERPALCPIRVQDTWKLSGLSGIRTAADVSILDNNGHTIFSEQGEVHFKENALSGIVIFNASRFVDSSKDQILILDIVPSMSTAHLTTFISDNIDVFAHNPEHLLDGLFRHELGRRIIELTMKDPKKYLKQPPIGKGKKKRYPHVPIKELDPERIAKQAKSLRFHIRDLTQYKSAQVTQGGISTNSINPKSLEFIHHKRLYACGEVLDIDGPCGGHNLTWAWLSGALAGKTAAYPA